jgi:hypothetical protein
MPRNGTPEWNTSVVWSVMSAIILSQILVQGQDQASSYSYFSLGGVSVHINTGAYKFFVFVFVGWFCSWIHFHLRTASTPIDDSRRNVLGLAGLCLWFAGLIVYMTTYRPPEGTDTIEKLQAHYQFLTHVDSLMVTLGGGLFYWSVRVQQFAIFANTGTQLAARRKLFALYIMLPSVCAMIVVGFNAPLSSQVISFVQLNAYYLAIAVCPLTLTLFGAVNIIDLSQTSAEDDDESVSTGVKVSVSPEGGLDDVTRGRVAAAFFHGLYVACSTTVFYLPFVHIFSYMVSVGAPASDVTQVILLLLGGAIVGKAIVAATVDFGDGGSYALPTMALVQTVTFSVWLAREGTYDLALMSAVGFFLGMSSMSTFVLAHIKSTLGIFPQNGVYTEPIMNVYHMTCMVPGGALLMVVTRSYTSVGSLSFPPLLSVATGLSAGATAASLAALFFSNK